MGRQETRLLIFFVFYKIRSKPDYSDFGNAGNKRDVIKRSVKVFKNVNITYPQAVSRAVHVAFDKTPERIQEIVDKGSSALIYCADGFLGYIDIVYPGCHIRNTRDKSEALLGSWKHYKQ